MRWHSSLCVFRPVVSSPPTRVHNEARRGSIFTVRLHGDRLSNARYVHWPLCIGIQRDVGTTSASDDEERLMVDVFRGYNSLIQPVKHLNDTPIVVKIALQLILLINVDEKDQVRDESIYLTEPVR